MWFFETKEKIKQQRKGREKRGKKIKFASNQIRNHIRECGSILICIFIY